MDDIKRILLECRYLISLNKSYADLAKHFNVSEEIIYEDLNNKLPKVDIKLYNRVKKLLK